MEPGARFRSISVKAQSRVHNFLDIFFSCVPCPFGIASSAAATPAVTDNIEIPTGIEGQAKRIQASFMYMSTPERAMGIHWVISNIVMEFLPLDFGEKERVRTAWLLSCLPSFPVLSLDRKVVKHMLVELYGATASTLKASLCKEASGRRLLHLNLDLWTCKYSSLKFIGEHAVFLHTHFFKSTRAMLWMCSSPFSLKWYGRIHVCVCVRVCQFKTRPLSIDNHPVERVSASRCFRPRTRNSRVNSLRVRGKKQWRGCKYGMVLHDRKIDTVGAPYGSPSFSLLALLQASGCG